MKENWKNSLPTILSQKKKRKFFRWEENNHRRKLGVSGIKNANESIDTG